MKAEKKRRYIYLYYALLLLVLASRQTATTPPSIVLRLAFMAAAIIPAILDKDVCYPAILTMFYTLSLDGFGYSYMPSTLSLYVIVTLVIAMFFSRNIKSGTIPIFILLFALYIFLIDLLFGVTQYETVFFQRTFYCFLLIMGFLIISGRNNDGALLQLPLCFAVTTLVLSIAFLTHREQFVLTEIGDMERTGWTDPNYFGMALGMGTVIGMLKMFSGEWKSLSFVEKAIYIAAVVISVPTLALNASRGAMLSVVVGFVALLLFSKAKLGSKIVFTTLSVIAVVYLYNNQYFELLEYRIYNDEGTGSGRTEIWAEKLSSFAEGNPLHMIFGYGHVKGSTISGRHIGFHSDYIGFLVDYGFVGLGLLLYMLFYPIRIALKGSPEKPSVIVLIVYLAICFVTLEPLLTGIMAYFSFYMYALLLAKNSTQNKTYVKSKNIVPFHL